MILEILLIYSGGEVHEYWQNGNILIQWANRIIINIEIKDEYSEKHVSMAFFKEVKVDLGRKERSLYKHLTRALLYARVHICYEMSWHSGPEYRQSKHTLSDGWKKKYSETFFTTIKITRLREINKE